MIGSRVKDVLYHKKYIISCHLCFVTLMGSSNACKQREYCPDSLLVVKFYYGGVRFRPHGTGGVYRTIRYGSLRWCSGGC